MTPTPRPGDPTITPALVAEHGLTRDEYDRLVNMLGRTPTFTELGIVSALWSEHCSYKHSRPLLRKLPTSAPYVLQGPGENAGVISIGDGLAVAFKIESHNHPSAVEPYQGAATGVGGILRDVFTMGARPIAMLNSLRFGSLDSPRVRYLVAGVVRGIGDYGKPFLLCFNEPGGPLFAKACDWWGKENVDGVRPHGMERPNYTGLVFHGVQRFLGNRSICGAVIEFGTRGVNMRRVLRLDQWLRRQTALDADVRETLQADMMDAFCPFDGLWRQDTLREGIKLTDQALAGLAAW